MSNLKNDNFIWLRFLHNVVTTPFGLEGPGKDQTIIMTSLFCYANTHTGCVGVEGDNHAQNTFT